MIEEVEAEMVVVETMVLENAIEVDSAMKEGMVAVIEEIVMTMMIVVMVVAVGTVIIDN